MPNEAIFHGSAVAIEGRALLIEGPPGAGKSSLALALIERGAALIGDDGLTLSLGDDGKLLASPPPNIAGLIEIYGVGIVALKPQEDVPVSLVLTLSDTSDLGTVRLPEHLATRTLLGCCIPVLPFAPGTIAPAARAQWALKSHGI